MNESLKSFLGGGLEKSPFLLALLELKGRIGRSRLYGDRVRPLRRNEIDALEAGGNRCGDWSKILVAEEFDPAFILNTVFAGDCVLGVFGGEEVRVEGAASLPNGIYDSRLVNCEVGSGCLVSRVALASSYIVKEASVVFDTGALVATPPCLFGNGTEIAIGIETGGREILSYADMTIPVASAVATRRRDKAFLAEYAGFVKLYLDACRSSYGVVERGAVIRHVPTVENVYVGESALIDGAALVRNSTLLSSAEERTEVSHGAFVRDSSLQYGCEATTMAIVDASVLTEHSHAERHGKITQSIIGPNTGVAEGEVTASLVGPFVGFHHQSMLIAAIWPEGKGNVAYGANIGSNHTSKAPDQEIWCGEGFFFGLGASVKFPCNYTGSPYGLIATAVDTLPQKVDFPFCLINKPSMAHEGIAPAFNEIFPAWVLSDNLYAVLRNEGKYKKRNKAKRTVFVFDVFRKDIIEMMVAARDRLRNIRTAKKFYTEEDIAGLGKNFMLESCRVKAIDTYSLFIEYFALQGLAARVARLVTEGPPGRAASVYDEATDDADWEYRRSLVRSEGHNRRSVAENLARLAEIHERIARDTERSKQKDDVRGKRIIPDYDVANTQAPDDGFVKETWERSARAKADLEALIAKLPRS